MSNLDIWNKLGKTDPAHTKGFKRGGGFTGTAIKPIYTEQKMTEQFGPVGTGWGFSEPKFQLVPGENKELLVYCWLSLWYVQDGVRSGDIPGVGGDKVIGYIKANEQYNRPERWENDDEAFKKAFTDAISNAMKHLGMSADVHMGLFDDSKYVSTRTEEEQSAKTTSALDTHIANINDAETLDALQTAFKAGWTAITAEAPRAKLKAAYDTLKAKLTPADDFPADAEQKKVA